MLKCTKCTRFTSCTKYTKCKANVLKGYEANRTKDDFANDFVELSIFSTSFKHACPEARTESLFNLVLT